MGSRIKVNVPVDLWNLVVEALGQHSLVDRFEVNLRPPLYNKPEEEASRSPLGLGGKKWSKDAQQAPAEGSGCEYYHICDSEDKGIIFGEVAPVGLGAGIVKGDADLVAEGFLKGYAATVGSDIAIFMGDADHVAEGLLKGDAAPVGHGIVDIKGDVDLDAVGTGQPQLTVGEPPGVEAGGCTELGCPTHGCASPVASSVHSAFTFEHMKCSNNLEHDSGRARHRAQRNRAKKDRRSQREAEPELVDPATAVGACGLAITSSSEGDANSQHPLVAVAAAWKALGEPLAAPD